MRSENERIGETKAFENERIRGNERIKNRTRSITNAFENECIDERTLSKTNACGNERVGNERGQESEHVRGNEHNHTTNAFETNGFVETNAIKNERVRGN